MAIKPVRKIQPSVTWGGGGCYGKGAGAIYPGKGCMGKGQAAMWGPMMAWGPPAWDGYDAPFAAAWGGKGGGAAIQPAMALGGVGVHWLALGEESANLPGMPLEAPAVVHAKGQEVFSYASNMLWDLVGELEGQVEIVDDAEWQQFPEVIQAIREAGAEENCIAVAACSSQAKWGVGMAGGWKHREAAAKVALCVAIAAEHPQVQGFLKNYPMMRPLLNGTAVAAAPPIMAMKASPFGFGAAASGAKSKKQKASAPPPEVEESMPEVTFVALTEESSITEQGFPQEAPAIQYDKTQSIFGSGHYILSELVGEITEEVSFVHDTDWDQLPEVAAALKAQGVGEECYCVASCEKLTKWAIGMAPGWKHRESAAKLALAVACVTPEGPSRTLAMSHPDFVQLLQGIGVEVDETTAAAPPPAKKAKKGKKATQNDLGGEMEAQEEFDPAAPPEEDAPLADGGLQTLPKEQPFWLRMEDPPAILVDGMPAESLLVVEGTGRKELYQTVDQFLLGFVGDVSTDIECVDDPDWSQFPEIAAVLEGYAIQDECLQVAICAQCGMWAAGIGRKWKQRNAAAKVALATLLAVKTAEAGEAVDCSEFPALGEFIEQATAAALSG